MRYGNPFEMASQKLVEYVGNAPGLLAMDLVGQYGGANRGPIQQGVMSQQQMGGQPAMARNGGAVGGGRGLPLQRLTPQQIAMIQERARLYGNGLLAPGVVK